MQRSRLTRARIARRVVVLGALASVVLSLATLLLLGISLDTSLGVAGMVFGVVTFVLSELREREAPSKTIAYLGQEDASFDANILVGIKSSLDHNMPYVLQPVTYTPDVGDPVAWQVAQLGSSKFETADAIVILPCHDDMRIWQAMVRLSSRGIKIVVMDFEPPQDLFVNQSLPIPSFVSSDFTEGGVKAGEIVASFLESHPHATALILIGPRWSKPGAGRSSRILFVLAQHGLLGRSDTMELTSWDPKTVVPGVLSRVTKMLSANDGELVIFAGDDRLLNEISGAVVEFVSDMTRLNFVGYDGARGPDGGYLVKNSRHCIGTIDTQPEAQGYATGKVLLDAYQNGVSGLSRVLVVPRSVGEAELNP